MLHLMKHGDEVGREEISEGERTLKGKKGCGGKENGGNKQEILVFMKDDIYEIPLCDVM